VIDPSLRTRLIIERKLRTLMHLRRIRNKGDDTKIIIIWGVMKTSLTIFMWIKPDHPDHCFKSSLPVTNVNTNKDPTNTDYHVGTNITFNLDPYPWLSKGTYDLVHVLLNVGLAKSPEFCE
jgi:hypothetical protein